MKTKFILAVASFFSILLINTTHAQNLPNIRVDGNNVLVVTDAFPLWLKEGQSLEISNNTQFISVLEFNKEPIQGGGNSLIFEDVVIVTTPAATVPNGKVWKVEYVGLNDNATLAGTLITQANSCQTPTNLQIVNNENATVTINWNAPANPPAYGYSISVMPAGLAPTSQDFFTVTGTTITVSTFSHDNSNINATTLGIGIDVYLISTCNVVTNQYSDPVNGQGTAVCDLDNLQLTDNLDGTVTANWTESISGFTPANNYHIAVVPQGTTPQPSDYVAESTTTHTTNQYTHNNNYILNHDNVDIYVYAECNANSDSDPINATTPSTCDTPTNFQVTNNYNGTITLNWNPPSTFTPSNNYMIAVVPQGITPTYPGDYVAESSTSHTANQYTHNNNPILNNDNVDVYVYAKCNTDSDSDPVTAATTSTCDLPTNLQLTDNGNSTITATWSVPTNNTPTNGYMIAVVPQGTAPQSSDYVAESSTSYTTGNYTNNLPIVGCSAIDIDVYVYAVCNANSDSDPINSTVNMIPNSPIYSFSNCTQTGRTGPSQSQCNTAYSGTTLAGLVTVTGGIQEWTVPATGAYIIEVAGAQGGNYGANLGALGAEIKGDFSFTQGDILKILVGQKGGDASTTNSPGGGGGGSFVVNDSGNTPLIIAGGGAGNGQYGLNGTNSIGQAGQNGGTGGGAGGTSGDGGNAGTRGAGGGGFNTNGGSSSYGSYGFAFLNGGNGGDSTGNCSFYTSGGFGGGASHGGNCNDNGGGGGGYSGGGGGSNSTSGGGGSFNSGTNPNNQAGVNTGHGYVNIQLVCP